MLQTPSRVYNFRSSQLQLKKVKKFNFKFRKAIKLLYGCIINIELVEISEHPNRRKCYIIKILLSINFHQVILINIFDIRCNITILLVHHRFINIEIRPISNLEIKLFRQD